MTARIVWGLYSFLLLGLATSRVFSDDLFWQMTSGRHMVETLSFLRQDTFSLTPAIPRYEHCWLHDVIFYLVWQGFGYTGVSVLKGVLVTATAWVLYATARVRGASPGAILALLPLLVTMTFWAWSDRPQLWSYLAVALFLWLLERHRRQPGREILWMLPLMVVWSNLHAAAILAFPVAGAYLVADFLPGGRRDRSLLVTVLALPVAALAIPYGTALLETLISSGELGRISIHRGNLDWRPTSYATYPDYYHALVLTAAMVFASYRRIALSDLFLLGGFGVMGMTLERHTPFFLLAGAALLPHYLDGLLEKRPQRLPAWPLAVLPLLLLAHFGELAFRFHGFFQPGLNEKFFPVAEARFVRQETLPPNLFNSFSAGGYLMFTLHPDHRVFWDGRQSSPEMWRQGLDVTYARKGWQEILERHQVHTIVTDVCSQVDGRRLPLVEALARDRRWALVFAGETHLVFVRADQMTQDWLQEHRLPASRIDDTLLSAATWLSGATPRRPVAWLEMALVRAGRNEVEASREAVLRYFAQVTTPDPRALRLWQWLQGKPGKEVTD